jgi:hypothetical protein
VAGLGKREELVWAQYFPGMYVVCSDGQEVGTLRATHVSGGGGARRSGWVARRVGTVEAEGIYGMLAEGAAALPAGRPR